MAKHKATKQTVAIKVLNKQQMIQKELVTKVSREIKVLQHLRHPHLIKVYDAFETDNKVYVVMEYAAGGELFDLIATRGRMREDKARTIFQQLTSCLEYCHNHSITHRDLKPENILFDDQEQIKVADFGLSNVMPAGRFLQTSCGSPNYAAPEVISGK